MTRCVAYYFVYARRRPRSEDDLKALFAAQGAAVQKLAATSNLSVIRSFPVLKTNRDRHFAETAEFRQAVFVARDVQAALVIWSLYELLCASHPDQIEEAANAVLNAGVEILDARHGDVLQSDMVSTMVMAATMVAKDRRARIKRGLVLSGRPRSAASHKNQPRAATGAARAADRRAENLRQTVDQVRAELPEGVELTASRLAGALNARGILTDRGNAYAPSSARALIKRLRLTNAG